MYVYAWERDKMQMGNVCRIKKRHMYDVLVVNVKCIFGILVYVGARCNVPAIDGILTHSRSIPNFSGNGAASMERNRE